ncbi:MAG: flagellar biosynthesis protein FlhF [Butyrivibrio sp.]|nr:flagellar biosynthesis protein FlhF [Butyrivibrio sp.]
MIVKKYKADTETAAILAAKEDLGPEAVVLNVKTMKQRGFARFFKHDYVEITAALEEKEFEQKVSSRRPAVNAAATKEIKPAADKMSGIDYRVDDSRYTETGKNTIEEKLDSLHDMLQSHMTGLDKAPGNAGEKDVEQKETSDNTAKPQSNNFKPLKLIYNKLMENEMDEKYANAIINDINASLKKESNIDSILAAVYQKIILKLGEPDGIETDERKKIIFFIGPTGVGKTTTIAKLASDFKLNKGKSVAMVTADTYRIAAVEQLNTYAGILDVPVSVAYSPSEICGCLNEFSGYDVIFVDTAGRSHKNEEQKDELIELINNVKNGGYDADIETFLVLSVTTKYKDLINIADTYKEIEDYRLLFTKLDETVTLGNIINLKCYTGAPLSYTTSGQNVPDDIETIDVQKLAKNLLGGE